MVVILNSDARSGEAADLRAKLERAFTDHGLTPKIITVNEPGQLRDVAAKVAHGSEETIVAAGGDGTVSAVAAQLAGRGKTMGVLPLGTLNHFAKDLGIPLELPDAVAALASGHTREVDAAEVNGRVFINNSSLGLYPRIVAQRETHEERLGKWPAFAWAALTTVRRLAFLRLRICVNDRELERKTAFLFVGNNEYEMAGFRIGGRERLDTGKLGLYLAHRAGRFGLFRLAVHALFHRLEQAKDFDAFCVEEALIESRRRRLRLLVALDGEVTWMETPLHYRSQPAALRVIVPRHK